MRGEQEESVCWVWRGVCVCEDMEGRCSQITGTTMKSVASSSSACYRASAASAVRSPLAVAALFSGGLEIRLWIRLACSMRTR
jgi:hypothetical protein